MTCRDDQYAGLVTPARGPIAAAAAFRDQNQRSALANALQANPISGTGSGAGGTSVLEG